MPANAMCPSDTRPVYPSITFRPIAGIAYRQDRAITCRTYGFPAMTHGSAYRKTIRRKTPALVFTAHPYAEKPLRPRQQDQHDHHERHRVAVVGREVQGRDRLDHANGERADHRPGHAAHA